MSKVDLLLNRCINAVIAQAMLIVIYHQLYPDWRVRMHKLWIKSPNGKAIKSLPFYQALRVVRKRDWRLIDTAPVEQQMTRWQAVKYIITKR